MFVQLFPVKGVCGTTHSLSSDFGRYVPLMEDCSGRPIVSQIQEVPRGVDRCGVCNGDGKSCADCRGIPNGRKWRCGQKNQDII